MFPGGNWPRVTKTEESETIGNRGLLYHFTENMTDIKKILNRVTGMQLAKFRLWESLPTNDLMSSKNTWQKKEG